MREIKFRAYDKSAKKMYQEVDSDFGRGENGRSVQIELMQFTGLLDKNGKEIYESDIMRWNNSMKSKEEYAKNPYSYSVVKWNQKDIKFEGCWGFEIIGNIYESKHLLDNTDTKV